MQKNIYSRFFPRENLGLRGRGYAQKARQSKEPMDIYRSCATVKDKS